MVLHGHAKLRSPFGTVLLVLRDLRWPHASPVKPKTCRNHADEDIQAHCRVPLCLASYSSGSVDLADQGRQPRTVVSLPAGIGNVAFTGDRP